MQAFTTAIVLLQVPKAWRQQMADAGLITGRSVIHRQDVASDGTRKLLLRLADGKLVETVGIPANEKGQQRLTVCVSSQVGSTVDIESASALLDAGSSLVLPFNSYSKVLEIAAAACVHARKRKLCMHGVRTLVRAPCRLSFSRTSWLRLKMCMIRDAACSLMLLRIKLM